MVLGVSRDVGNVMVWRVMVWSDGEVWRDRAVVHRYVETPLKHIPLLITRTYT